MASILIIKEKIKNPKEWYDKVMQNSVEWEYDEILKSYHVRNVYLTEKENSVSFEDMSEEVFFGWETSAWIEVADNKELIYGYYNDCNCYAEFVHIKNRKCIRDYREYDDGIDTNEGNIPEFNNWVDVASYVDEKML